MLILILLLLSNFTNAKFNLNNLDSSELFLPSNIDIERESSSYSSYSKEIHSGGAKKCEEITVPMCRNIDYNTTSFPNQFNHESQQEAAAEAHQFWALVEINCAKELRFFLCSMYTPICLPNYPQPIKACRSVCVRARMGCEKYMKKFGFDWPEHMNCDLFPEYGSSKEVCMDPMDAEEQQQRKKLTINHNINNEITDKINKINSNNIKSDKNHSFKLNKKINLNEDLTNTNNDIIKYEIFNKNRELELMNKMCEMPFLKITDLNDPRMNKFSTAGLINCVQPCNSVFFDQSERQLTYYWLLFWSFLCLFSSLCTTCTYLIESARFKYPEKPIIYMSICYLFVSLGYMIRFLVGHEQMGCESDGSIKYSTLNSSNSLGSISCTLTFILSYYFGMASSVWWVIVSLTWFLAAGLKWGSEAISKYGVYFHLFAWVLPFIKTVMILSFSLIDADSLTGMCYVGNLSTYNLRVFVILPACVYLALGITFLVSGFISLIRIRNMIKKQHSDMKKAHKIEKLMIRIGIFSILYTVPASCVIACQLYEFFYRKEWEKTLICNNKQIKNKFYFQYEDQTYNLVEDFCSKNINNNENNNNFKELPEFSIFIIKYLMSLIVGVTSGFWIWTEKSLKSWRKFFKRLFSFKSLKSTEHEIDNGSSSDESQAETKCCSLFSTMFDSKKRIKKSIVYFQANDDIENNNINNNNNIQQFYDNAGLNKIYQSNFEIQQNYQNQQNYQKQYQQNNQLIYNIPESMISLPISNTNNYSNNLNNGTSTISTTVSNPNQYYASNQYKLLANKINTCQTNNKQNVYLYDYNSSSTYRNDKGTINTTTTTTTGSSLPSTASLLLNQ